MGEDDLVIGQLRGQAQRLQVMLSYLESRRAVGWEEYAYVHTTLHDVVGRLKDLGRFASQRGQSHRLRTQWAQAN